MLYKAGLNGVAVCFLYLSYRYSDNIPIFTICMLSLIYIIVKLYKADKTT